MESRKRFVENNIIGCQTYLVNDLISNELIDIDSIEGEWFDVLEWWLVTDYGARRLQEQGEAILEDYNCHWWGRRTSGQAIYLDGVIAQIVIR